ncbi:MAG TPA: hypothetical protein VG942_01725 [Hyphomonadaceae bacterium]|nr:hypothetical protein [Hyphomonadaceae bacterium]
MPLQFPIASTARAALDTEGGARTVAEARELAGGPVTLVSEWLRPQAAEREDVQGKAEAGIARGFVQLYEDAKGRPVIAVTFWKPTAGVKTRVKKTKAQPDAVAPVAPGEDHTDDLYFQKPGARTKKRKRAADPNQLDLFTGPDQQGAETPDPHNPLVVIVDEEGDGAAFGIGEEKT